MKKIYCILLATFGLFAFVPVANALDDDPPYKEKNHIAYSKYPTGPENGIYTIHLDTFVTGEKTIKETSIPADIVLVLDVSGSMNGNLSTPTYSYTARASQGYSYSSYGYNTYYYKHADGNYYEVSRGGSDGGWFSDPSRYLRFRVGRTWYYLNGTSVQGTAPQGYGDNDTIWTGVLYTRETHRTKISALRAAVKNFIDVVQQNDLYYLDGRQRETPLGNQISIVKFAMDQYYDDPNDEIDPEKDIKAGNNLGAGSDGGYANAGDDLNYTEVLAGFTPTSTNSATNGTQYLKNRVDAITVGGGTAIHYGIKKAEHLLESITRTDSFKTVVVFTDGMPQITNTQGFFTLFANDAISNSKAIKDLGATVFSVGLFSNLGNNATNVSNFMNYISSNYPKATSMTDPDVRCDHQSIPAADRKDPVFYKDASNADLSAVFITIAQASGGSQATEVTAEAATTVDVVSQSFDLPYGSDPNSIKVYFANCTGVDDDGYLTFDDYHNEDEDAGEVVDHRIPNPAKGEDGHVTITIDEASQKVTASGFDYSGNWCGYDETLATDNKYRGMKLMLEIPIEMADDAVGGNAVGTNGPESGIYVNGEPLLKFDIPHIDLPTNLHIKKEGIADGECATFLIYRKPLTPETSSWETTPFKTVIVIGGQHENTVKLMGLDPHYLYKIVEGGWSWSYNLDHVEDFEGNTLTGDITSDKLITNPFIFVNSKKNTKVRHAESAVYNDFRTAGKVTGVDAVGETQKKQETSSESTETK